MDKFLEVVFDTQITGDFDKGDKCLDFFQPFLGEIKEIVNEKVYERLEEIFINCASENDETCNRYHGWKLYTPNLRT